MNGTQRLAGCDRISDRDMKVDARRFVVRRAGELGQAGDPAIVDGMHVSRSFGYERSALPRLRRNTHSALRLADTLKLLPGAAVVERRRGHCLAAAFERGTGEFEQHAGE